MRQMAYKRHCNRLPTPIACKIHPPQHIVDYLQVSGSMQLHKCNVARNDQFIITQGNHCTGAYQQFATNTNVLIFLLLRLGRISRQSHRKVLLGTTWYARCECPCRSIYVEYCHYTFYGPDMQKHNIVLHILPLCTYYMQSWYDAIAPLA